MDPLHVFDLHDHKVVLRPASDRICLLNGSAFEVLEGLRQRRTAAQIADTWVSRHGLAPREASALVRQTVAQLRSSGMVGRAANGRSARRVLRPAVASHARSPAMAMRIGRYPFSLRFADERTAQALTHVWSHLRANGPARGPVIDVARGMTALDLGYRIAQLAQRDDDQLLVLHAGAVGRGGRCLAICGASGSGKSTLVAYLASHGFDYLAEDMLPIDERTLAAESVPGCIGLKPGSWPIVAAFRPELECLPMDRGSREPVKLLPPPLVQRDIWKRRHKIAALILLDRNPTTETRLEPLPATQALRAIIDTQAYFRRPLSPERIGALVKWIAKLPAYCLHYGDLRAAVKALGPLLR